ncbi:NHL repeat-containing protein [Hymenobacter norwichensis]|uniref:NHL repeat-containing protein n=1 Tax=Hymenobacter norwichensis TaxID=223903 RepID=UPI0003B69198|nr:NHL repeat-containing protein [Hymenobacter norwichensis]
MKCIASRYVVALLLLAAPAFAQRPATEVLTSRVLPATVTTVAGMAKQEGSTDGAGAAARFNRPMGIALAPDGTVYVADANNHTIRRITPTGVVSTFAGQAGVKGSLDGTGAAARFNTPAGLALDAQGTLYVTDGRNQTIRQVTPAGVVTTLAGQVGQKGSADGPGAAAQFNFPHGIAVAASGLLYVTDTENHVVRTVSATGEVNTLAGVVGKKGAVDGAGPTVRFFHPSGIALDARGTLYVVDNGSHTIRTIHPTGEVRTLAGLASKHGATDGQGPVARFDNPNSIAIDAQGVLYLADYINSTVRRITPTGEVTTLAGHTRSWGHQDGPAREARFEFPFGVAVSADGSIVYVADTQNQLIRRIQ